MCRKRVSKLNLGLAQALLFASCGYSQVAAYPPDLILRNGHIFTGDARNPWVAAISMRSGTILAIGTDAVIGATAGPHTQMIDLQGHMAMPGINDSHEHQGGAYYGVEAKLPPSHGPDFNPSIEEISVAVSGAAHSAPPGMWIYAGAGPAETRHGKEASLAMDKAGEGHPVLLDAATGHGVVLNKAGMVKVGLTDAVKDPIGGHYERDAEGHLTGLLEESAGNAIKQRLSTEMGIEAAVKQFRAYAERRLQQGVTSVQVMVTNQRLSALKKSLVEANVPLRVRIMRFPLPEEDALGGEQQGSGEEILSPTVRVAGVKYVLDGTPIEELAYQTKDYADRPGWRGRLDYSVEFIDAQLKLALLGRDQLLMHVAGDATANTVLDEMEKLAPAEKWRPPRGNLKRRSSEGHDQRVCLCRVTRNEERHTGSWDVCRHGRSFAGCHERTERQACRHEEPVDDHRRQDRLQLA